MTSSALASLRSVSKEGLRDPVSKWAIELGGSPPPGQLIRLIPTA